MNGIREFASAVVAAVAQVPSVLAIGLVLIYVAIQRASRKYGE